MTRVKQILENRAQASAVAARMGSVTTTRISGALTLQLYERLRADIVRGRLRPGDPLRVAARADSYDASMTSVREALVRLAEQHLAVLTPNVGFRTAPVSREDLVHLTELRVTLETRAAELSVQQGDAVWEAGLVEAHRALVGVLPHRDGEPGSTDEWVTSHAAFHDALVGACGNPRLLALTRSLRDEGELYRQRSDAVDRHRDVAGEHAELLELALARRSTETGRALERHLRLTARLILDHDLQADAATSARH